jgi:hypothetical protein
MRRALHQVLSTLATKGAHRRFGVCQDCTYFGREMCGNLPSTGPSAAECLLFAAPFYRRMGAYDVGQAPSGSVPGRMLPKLVMNLCPAD